MDATEEFIASKVPGYNIKKWMAMGASKRGWTTWLLGAVAGDRLMGIAPVVMDLLNFSQGVQHMWQTLGNWTFAFTDYLDMGIPGYFGTPVVDVLAAVIDPLMYKENLTMPKLVIDATGDEFFQIQVRAPQWHCAGTRHWQLAWRCRDNRVPVAVTALLLVVVAAVGGCCRTTSTGGASCPARPCA